jgi:hypothetical protein
VAACDAKDSLRQSDYLRMHSARRALRVLAVLVPGAALCALPLASIAGATAPGITGKIRGADDYTLLALAPNGSCTIVKLGSNGSFRVPAHRGWTLQLLGPNSHYFGPIVLRHKGTRAWEALSGESATLGTIVLHKGYAAPQRQVSSRATETSKWLHVSAHGVPTGAGNLGLIPRKGKHGGAKVADVSESQPPGSGTPPPPGSGTPPPPGSGTPPAPGSNSGSGSTLQGGEDPDQDGIPTAFDADAIGSGEPNQENAQASQGGAGGGIFTQVGTPIAGSVNLDAGTFSSEEMTQFIHRALGLDLGLQDPALGTIKSVSVSCGTLTYCATATVAADAGNVLAHGSVWNGEVPPGNSPGMFQLALQLNTTPSEIQPGDTYQIQYTTATETVTVPAELTLYFASVPAVSSIGTGTGAAAASSPQTITYPASTDVYGSVGNPVMLDGDSINLAFWRPQRAAFPGEAGSYVDMGHLHYGAGIAVPNGTDNCAASDFSELSQTLSDTPPSGNSFYDASYPLVDSAADAPPSSANKLGFTLNLDDCLAADGQATTGREIVVGLAAADDPRGGASDSGDQSIYVCLPGCTVGDVAGPGGNEGQAPAMTPPAASSAVFLRRLPTLWPAAGGG